MEQDPMKLLEEKGVKFEVMSEEEVKAHQPMIDAFKEHTAIEASIEYFIKIATENAKQKEMKE